MRAYARVSGSALVMVVGKGGGVELCGRVVQGVILVCRGGLHLAQMAVCSTPPLGCVFFLLQRAFLHGALLLFACCPARPGPSAPAAGRADIAPGTRPSTGPTALFPESPARDVNVSPTAASFAAHLDAVAACLRSADSMCRQAEAIAAAASAGAITSGPGASSDAPKGVASCDGIRSVGAAATAATADRGADAEDKTATGQSSRQQQRQCPAAEAAELGSWINEVGGWVAGVRALDEDFPRALDGLAPATVGTGRIA